MEIEVERNLSDVHGNVSKEGDFKICSFDIKHTFFKLLDLGAPQI